MHEITCEQNGIVKEICAQNGDAVEYGQKLFIIEEDLSQKLEKSEYESFRY